MDKNYNWIRARELAHILNIPVESVWRLTRNHTIPAYKVAWDSNSNNGNSYRYDLDKVLNVMRGNEDKSPKGHHGFLI